MLSLIVGDSLQPDHTNIALKDIRKALREFSLAGFLAWQDIRRRYVRTMLGPWWIVLSMGIWLTVVGYIMSNILHVTLREYLPFLVSGMLVWTFISTSITESSLVLIHSGQLIRCFPIPIFTHYLRFILRNFIVFLHSAILLIAVMLMYPPPFTPDIWLVIPGLLLNMVILVSLAICLSLANLCYRDTHLAVTSNLQILPFVTPIMWNRGMLQNHAWVADINPVYHMIEVVRGPLIGQAPKMLSWIVTGGLAASLLLLALFVFVRLRHRIILWL